MNTENILNKMRQKTKQYVEQGQKFRLPDGAKFEATYDARTSQWSLTLTIGEAQYPVVASGIHWALRKAGKRWWDNHAKERRKII